MSRIMASAGLAVVLAFGPGAELQAQWLWEPGLPGSDIGSLAVQGGMLQTNTSFEFGDSFDSGAGFGATLSYWPFTHFGLRTGFFRAETAGTPGDRFTAIGGHPDGTGVPQNPVIWVYSLDVAARYPMAGDRIGWFPYAAAGFGGKSFRWNPDRPRVGSTFATWTAAGGLELRVAGGQVGLFSEIRAFLYDFAEFDYRTTPQSTTDLLISVGVTVNR